MFSDDYEPGYKRLLRLGKTLIFSLCSTADFDIVLPNSTHPENTLLFTEMKTDEYF